MTKTGTDSNTESTDNNRLKTIKRICENRCATFNWNVTSKIRDRVTPEVGVLVAIANNLDDLILMLRGKSFLAVINGNEAETNETFLEAGGKGNG